MRGDQNDARPTAVLTNWILVLIGEKMHLIGVVDAHTRFPTGHWIITSPLSEFDPVGGTAKTSSSGRRFLLQDRWKAEAPPGAQDIVARAIETWRLPSDVAVRWEEAVAPT